MTPGTLYVVATPIGNLEDITLRAVRVLRAVRLIASEDTRRTARLLAHFDISAPTTSLHEHNERTKTPHLLARLNAGDDIAFVTDAGTPGIADPSARLVAAAVAGGIEVTPVPGPSALVAALSASGFDADSFTFGGFLAPKGSARREAIAALAREPRTVILYEAPHRIRRTLADLAATMGARRACVARELTKIHEEWLRGTLDDLAARLSRVTARGEFVIVIDRQVETRIETGNPAAARAAYDELVRKGLSRKEAIKEVARQFGVSSRAIFGMLEATKLPGTDREAG